MRIEKRQKSTKVISEIELLFIRLQCKKLGWANEKKF